MQRIIALAAVLLLCSCKTTKDTLYDSGYDIELLDTLTVTAPVYVEGEDEPTYELPIYNAAADRTYDLLHTKLELSFDWAAESVIGKATLTATPVFYEMNNIFFDAKGFEIVEVSDPTTGRELSYLYDGKQITIDLGKTYQKDEEIHVYIDYVAHPSESSGSAAITSDKGLFFINADGSIPDKPRQIWTQGETEHNSKWFPTFDKPNERTTQEIYLTVDKNLQTLSNGQLISSTVHGDGTKTDYWKQDIPHAPYLAMVAVGDFARVKDSWNGKPLEYLVDPPYEADAKAIFDHTPEMLTFFSDLLDYPYPWDKYSQVVVEDFVSGAMENTTAVTFGDFVQKTSRELIDNGNDKIVAHEMFHHWFGDLVTCESWANLTLNEGFANYSEYLWYEHKYGKDAADHHRNEELYTYLFVIGQSGTHPLIHYAYEQQEDMFDVHSYNKGGLVLHMLRQYIGDAAFFASLNKYLHDNKYTAVEVDELRMAFEDTTGRDLQWFFDQWYLDEGHPTLEVIEQYSSTDSTLSLIVNQVQDVAYHRPVFILPMEVAIIQPDGTTAYHSIRLDSRTDTIVIDNVEAQPLATILDGKAYTLAEIQHERSQEAYAAILQYSDQWTHKMDATQRLTGTATITNMCQTLLQEGHYSLRLKGVEVAKTEKDYDLLKQLATADPHSKVRASALQKYADKNAVEAVSLAKQTLDDTDGAYPPLQSALNVLYDHDKKAALDYAQRLTSDPSPSLLTVLADIFAESGDAKYLPYIRKNLEKVDVYQVFNVYGAYSSLLIQQDTETMYAGATGLIGSAKTAANLYRRYMSTNTIHQVLTSLQDKDKSTPSVDLKSKINVLSDAIIEIKSQEKHPDLIARYKSF